MEALLFPDMIKKAKPKNIYKALQAEFYQRLKESMHNHWFGDDRLSSREFYIVRLISTGSVPKEVADFLNLSHNTITTHLKNIYTKLGIHKQTELVTWYNTKLLNGNVK